MVGDEGDPGGTAARLTTAARRPAAGPAGPGADVRAAYDAAAGLWAAGPERVYAALAAALLASADVPLAGRRVLDMGAGTGRSSIMALESRPQGHACRARSF